MSDSASNTEDEAAPPTIRGGRRKVWVRVLVIVSAVLLTGSLIAVFSGVYLIHQVSSNVHQANLLGSAAATTEVAGGAVTHASIDGPINVLLLGIDERADDPEGGARSDTIIVAHIPASHDKVYLISVPRDSRVKIPAFDKTGYGGGTDKINAAFSAGYNNGGGRDGGFELAALTMKHLIGISFNAGAIINFAGFQAVVDAVGGVDLCVDEKTISVHIGTDSKGNFATPYRLVPPDYHPVAVRGVTPVIYYPGCQHMSGWQALDYVRQRELIPDGDYGRERHQQQFIEALTNKMASVGMLTNPLGLNKAVTAAAGALTLDTNGVSFADWIWNLSKISPSDVIMVKTNAGQFNTEVIGGQDFEILSDDSLKLFKAVKDDTVGDFVAAHPTWVSGVGQVTASANPSTTPTGRGS